MLEKLFPRNEGMLDRAVRVAAGCALLTLLTFGPVPGWGLVGLIGLVPLLTGLAGSCPIYTLFGASTCARTP